MINLNEKEKKNALNEVRLIASIRHPNIIEYKESFIEDKSQTLCLVMEYADGGDLAHKISKMAKEGSNFSPDEATKIISQMVLGLKALHDNKICHRDLKCANIFLTKQGQVKLGDFNVSKVLQRGMLHTQTGTPYYASPEVWQDKPYDYKSDIWSLGCIIYEIIAKSPPFKATSMKELFKKVTGAKYPPLKGKPFINFPNELVMLIRLILNPNPRLRPSCSTLLNQDIIKDCIDKCSLNYESTASSDLRSDDAIPEKKKPLLNTIYLTPKLNMLN